MTSIKKKNNKGVILIEAILALGVIVIILTALVTALVSSLSTSTYSRDQSVATSYAQEGLEIARNDKDIDFNGFQAINGTRCLSTEDSVMNGPSTSYSSPNCARIDNKFTRIVYVNGNGRDPVGNIKCEPPESVYVASALLWTDSRCTGGVNCRKVELSSCFANLNSFGP